MLKVNLHTKLFAISVGFLSKSLNLNAKQFLTSKKKSEKWKNILQMFIILVSTVLLQKYYFVNFCVYLNVEFTDICFLFQGKRHYMSI